MAKAYDIPADELITHLAENLKRIKKLRLLNGLSTLRQVVMLKKSPKIEIGGICDVHHC